MINKNNGKINIRSIILDTVSAICAFIFLSLPVAMLVKNEIIDIKYLSLIMLMVAGASSMTGAIIAGKKTKEVNRGALLMLGSVILVTIIIIIAACQKVSGANVKNVVLTSVFVIAGQVIPNVINNNMHKSKSRNNAKRGRR